MAELSSRQVARLPLSWHVDLSSLGVDLSIRHFADEETMFPEGDRTRGLSGENIWR